MNATRSYSSDLRRQQAEATRDRILDAVSALIEELGAEALSNRVIAERAGVKEITVYRHFPNREALLSAAWQRANQVHGVRGGFPATLDEVAERIAPLFESFDISPAHIQSTITTTHGRALRAARDEDRRAAFLAAIGEIPGLGDEERRAAASILQLLYSAYAWLSLREQWGMDGNEAADAASWAARTLIDELRARGAASSPTSVSRKEKP